MVYLITEIEKKIFLCLQNILNFYEFFFSNYKQEQQTSCTGKLQQTTGLIQFCIEALKETDSAAFLQVCYYCRFNKIHENISRKSFHLNLNHKSDFGFVERLKFSVGTTALILVAHKTRINFSRTQNNNNTLIGFGCFL